MQFLFQIDQIDRELNRELFKDRKVRSKYLDVMAASVIIFNPSYLGRIQAYKDMREVLKFEQKLIEVLKIITAFFNLISIQIISPFSRIDFNPSRRST